ncbi:MAG TPA: LpqB family beta-propeller domain-containing protein [Acidothermaceae bacterium]|nr:LpqB family beta-propeller domain-containing protein [Acidothermaceae bacterium]
MSRAARGKPTPLRAALFLVAAGILAAGCTAIPTSGGVHAAGAQKNENEPPSRVVVQPQGPVEGASPTDIVDGFRFASADFADISISRSFLVDPTWQPDQGVRVIAEQSGPATFTPQGDHATVRYVDNWIGTIAGDGTYQPTSGNQTVDYTYELVKDTKTKGQWRILNPPPFLTLPQSWINANFNSGYLYFLSPRNDQVLVPIRVFLPITGTDAARELVLQLLAGPPKWLQDAGVTSAIPSGVQLQSVTQSRSDGVVTVNLSPEIASLSASDRDAASAQLVYTLQGYGGGQFKIEAAGQPVENSHHVALQSTKTWSAYNTDALDAGPFYFIGGDHRTRNANGEPIPGDAGSGAVKFLSVAVAPKAANNPGPDLIAGVDSDGSTQHLYVGAMAQPKRVDFGAAFTTPSWDMFGNVWTVRTETPGGPQEVRVSPVTQAGTTKFMTVSDPELAASQLIETLRVSRDGTRVAVIAKSAAAGPQLLVGHVVKTQGGESISGFYPVAPSLVPVADGVVWASSTKLEVLATASGASSPSIWSVDVDGWNAQQVPTPAVDIVSIAQAPDQPLVIGTKSGQIEVSVNDAWQVVATGSMPSYPG